MNLKTLNFHVTNRCNLRCRHCLYCSGEKRVAEMSTADVKSVLKQFAAISGRGGTVNLYGGEPLLREDIFEILDYIHELGLNAGMTTNAHAGDSVLQRLAETPMSRITIDLDGAKAESHDWLRNRSGHFEHSLEALRFFKSRGKYVSVNAVLHNGNIAELEALLELSRSTGIDMINFYLFTPLGRGKELESLLISPVKWKASCRLVKEWAAENNPSFGILWEKAYEYAEQIPVEGKDLCSSPESDVIDLRCDGEAYFCGLFVAVDAPSLGNVLRSSLAGVLAVRSLRPVARKKGCAALGFRDSGDMNNLRDFRREEEGIIPVCPYDWQIVAGREDLKKKFAHINLQEWCYG